jgi:hypothetical protein
MVLRVVQKAAAAFRPANWSRTMSSCENSAGRHLGAIAKFPKWNRSLDEIGLHALAGTMSWDNFGSPESQIRDQPAEEQGRCKGSTRSPGQVTDERWVPSACTPRNLPIKYAPSLQNSARSEGAKTAVQELQKMLCAGVFTPIRVPEIVPWR